MLPTDVVEEPDQDPAPSEGPARSDPEDRPGTHYIDPSFRNELQKVINFEVKYSFRRNDRVIVTSPTDTVDNPPPGCVAVYLEALELGLRFSLPKIVMDILHTYEIAIAQLVPNAWASILSFAATCKLKQLECTALAFTYTHIIQRNSKTCGGKGWYRIIGPPGFLSALDKPTSIHGWKYRFVFVKKESGEWSIPTWNRRGPKKTWNKPRTTPSEREIATYFRVVDSVHPRSGKSVKGPGNWLPRRVLFNYECFSCAAGLCSAMPRGNPTVTYTRDFEPLNLILLRLFHFVQVKRSTRF